MAQDKNPVPYLFVIQYYKFNTFIANHQFFNYLIFVELTLFNF